MNVLRSRIGRGHLYAQVYLEQLLSDPHGDPDVDAEDGSCHSVVNEGEGKAPLA